MYRDQKLRKQRELEKEEEERLSYENEKERRSKLQDSCKPGKVRTYACNEDGYRLTKHFTYKYDFESEQCVEKVQQKKDKCKNKVVEEVEDDEDEVLSYKKYKEMKKKKLIDENNEDNEEEVKPKKVKIDKKKLKNVKAQKASEEKDEEKTEAKVEAETEKTEATAEEQPVQAAVQTKQLKVQSDASADKEDLVERNSADSIGDSFEKQDPVAKKPSSKKSSKKSAVKKASKSTSDDVSTEVKKLSKHIGLIEGEVSEITKRYEELKQSKEEEQAPISIVQVKSSDQQKIEKFATMLKTLNSYKSQYKVAKNSGDKK